MRRLDRVESKDQLQLVEKEIQQECLYVDFSQVLADKEAFITLGKRPSKNLSYSSSEEEVPAKRVKTSEASEIKKANVAEDESSSSSENDEGDS